MVFEESVDNREYFCKANVDFFSAYDILAGSQQIPSFLSKDHLFTPNFFRILDFQAEPFVGFSHARPESDIYDVSMSKNFCTTILAKLRGVQHGQNA